MAKLCIELVCIRMSTLSKHMRCNKFCFEMYIMTTNISLLASVMTLKVYVGCMLPNVYPSILFSFSMSQPLCIKIPQSVCQQGIVTILNENSKGHCIDILDYFYQCFAILAKMYSQTLFMNLSSGY